MKILKSIIGWASLFLIIIMVIVLIIYKFSNPELTETQFLIKTLWGLPVSMVLLAGINWGLNE